MRIIKAILISIISIGLYILATWFVQLGFNPIEWETHNRAFWVFGLIWSAVFPAIFADTYR